MLSCAAAAACSLAGSSIAGAATAATVNISTQQLGTTPRWLGFNMGHYLPNSNTSAWLQYSGANGYRVWASANDYEGADDQGTYGDGVTTQAQFESRKTAMRANPESSTYANWTLFNDRFTNLTQSGRNNVKLNTILGELQKNGVEPILNLTRTESYSYSGWGGKWEQWQFAYVMAYHAAKNYDVQRFQWYNEPDQTASTITVADYADRLRTTADAFRSAVADVNAMFGKSLVANVSAPTTKSGSSTYDEWGTPIVQANRTDYAGNVSPVDIFNTYDLHRYNATAGSFSSDISTLNAKIPLDNPSGLTMPVTFTEFNRYNTSTFSGMTESMDTPQVFSEYAGDYLGAMSANVKGMYAFKFSQTVWTDPGFAEPMKTGHYYVEDFGNNNITGASQGAEVARLMTKAFKSERPRFNTGMIPFTASGTWGASKDQGKDDYYFAASNPSTTSYDLTMDLTPWAITPGQVVSIQEVSSVHHGSVSQLVTVGADRKINFSQPAQSVVLLNIPGGGLQTVVPIGASADAQVNNAATTINYGALPGANVARNASTTADQVTYYKFDLGTTNKATVDRALLRLTGENTANSALTTLHVYGINNDSWNELTINWNNAPDLVGASDAKLINVGSDALPVGQLTFDDDSDTWRIDVTDFVRAQGDANVSFAVIREQRFAGDSDTSVIQLGTKESLTGTPELTLFTLDKPQYFWKNNYNNSDFTAAANWDGGGAAPNSAGAIALLGDFSTANHAIQLSSNATLGELRFDNNYRYTLSGSSTLTFDGGAGSPSAIRVYRGDPVINTPMTFTTGTTVQVDGTSTLTFGNKPLAGSGMLTKTGTGTLVMSNSGASFSGGVTINSGTVRVTSYDINFITGLGTGPVVLNDATLHLDHVHLGASGKPGPDLTLNNGAKIVIDGATGFSKSGSPMVALGSAGSPVSATISTVAASDTFTILSAWRNTAAGSSFATVNLAGPGRVILQSGGVSATNTYSGSWNITGGSLQLGPTSGSSSEALNGPGFKNGDAKQANSINVASGGTLIGAVSTPQDGAVTPSFFRAGVTLAGGKLGSASVDSNWGGNFATSGTSTVLVYDPLATTTARSVSLVAGAAGSLNNAASTSWAGTLIVSPGTLANGGSFNVNRTGGTISVASGAAIQIDAGAKLNLGGSADTLNDGVRRANITNNSVGGFNTTAGTKNIGNLAGCGSSSVAAGATLIANHVRQSSATVNGTMRVRDNGSTTGTSDLESLTINTGGAFDLRDNDLVLRSTPLGSWNGSVYTGATGMIAKGRGDGSWNGSGLVTSMSDATSSVLTTLAVATAAEANANGTWSGRSVADDDVVVMYTFGGDADLNGVLDGDDYFFIDSNIILSGTVFGFHNGDFDYNGEINGDDYFIIDSNYPAAQQMGSFGSSMSIAPVPEPASLSLLTLVPVFARRRRRN